MYNVQKRQDSEDATKEEEVKLWLARWVSRYSSARQEKGRKHIKEKEFIIYNN